MALKKFEPSVYKHVPKKVIPVLAETLKQNILDYGTSRPRNLQISLGPSSAGDPCDRKLVGLMTGIASGATADSNPWLAMVGTAVHAMLADMLEMKNDISDGSFTPRDWLIEQKLDIHPPSVPEGSVDWFHIPSGTVGDWKIVGKSTLDSVKQGGPSEMYRIQAHIYGYGIAQLGYQVNKIMICFLPRNASPQMGFLQEAEWFEEDWDLDIAVNALKRVDKLHQDALALDARKNLKKLILIPATPGKSCFFCPFKTGNICPDAVS